LKLGQLEIVNKILNLNQAIKKSEELRNQDKIVVLVGGIFDILHIGHILFLQEAKKLGDILIILLESDKTVKKLKGSDRPFNTQKDRAEILAVVSSTDVIIPLPYIEKDEEYDRVVISLKPDIIAVTKNDPDIIHKKRQAEILHAKIVEVVERLPYSTSKLAQLLKNDIA